MTAVEKEPIRLESDNTAVYERGMVLPAENGTPTRHRLLDTKKV